MLFSLAEVVPVVMTAVLQLLQRQGRLQHNQDRSVSASSPKGVLSQNVLIPHLRQITTAAAAEVMVAVAAVAVAVVVHQEEINAY